MMLVYTTVLEIGFYSNKHKLFKVHQRQNKKDPSLTNSQTTRNGQKNW